MKIAVKIYFSFLAILLKTTIFAQPVLSKEQQAIHQTVIRFFYALSNKDSCSLKKYSAPDIVLYEYGGTWNIDTLILKAVTLNTDISFKRSNSFNFINTTTRKNTAWVSYYLVSKVSTTSKKTTIHWQETVVAVKEKKQWRIKVLHSTLLKRD